MVNKFYSPKLNQLKNAPFKPNAELNFASSILAPTPDKMPKSDKNSAIKLIAKGEQRHGLSQARDFSKPFGTKTWEFEDTLCGKVIITADVFKHDNLMPWGYYIKDKNGKSIELPGWSINQTGKADAKAVILKAYVNRRFSQGIGGQVRGINAVDRPEYNLRPKLVLGFSENSLTTRDDKITSYRQQMGQSLMLLGAKYSKTNTGFEVSLTDDARGARLFAMAEAALGGERYNVSVIPDNASRSFIQTVAIERRKIKDAKQGEAAKELASAFWECLQGMSVAGGAIRGGRIRPPSKSQLERMALAQEFYQKAQGVGSLEQTVAPIAKSAPNVKIKMPSGRKNIIPIKRQETANGTNKSRSYAQQDRHFISSEPPEQENIPKSVGQAIKREQESFKRIKDTIRRPALNLTKPFAKAQISQKDGYARLTLRNVVRGKNQEVLHRNEVLVIIDPKFQQVMPKNFIADINKAWDAIQNAVDLKSSQLLKQYNLTGDENFQLERIAVLQDPLPKVPVVLQDGRTITATFLGSGQESNVFLMGYPNQPPLIKLKKTNLGVGYSSPAAKMEAAIFLKNNQASKQILKENSIDIAVPLLSISGNSLGVYSNDLTVMQYIPPYKEPYPLRKHKRGRTLANQLNAILQEAGIPDLVLDCVGSNVLKRRPLNGKKNVPINIDPFADFGGPDNPKPTSYGNR